MCSRCYLWSYEKKYHGIKYHGVDPDETCILYAKKYPEAKFEVIDFLSNNQPDDYYDFVLIWNWFICL